MNESMEICSFKEFRKFAKSLGYKISSHVVSFGGFGYGNARFYKVFNGGRHVKLLRLKDKDNYVNGFWEKAMSMDKDLQEFVLSHKIVDDGNLKCIAE